MMDKIAIYEDALREVQRLALGIICDTSKERVGTKQPQDEATKALGGIYNYCETVLRNGRHK